MSRNLVEVAVIGAGVVGCAIASALARTGLGVALLEREARECTQTSARSSGVIHSGIYAPPSWLKARLCVEGRQRLYAWARAHGVPHRRTGKLVVAVEERDRAGLVELGANAEACGASGCILIDAADLLRRQPGLPRHPAALWCPDSGIIDVAALTRSLLRDAEDHGAWVAMSCELLDIQAHQTHFRLDTARGPLEVGYVVNSCGLFADEIAARCGLNRAIRPCRGDYFALRDPRHFAHLIYPAPAPAPAPTPAPAPARTSTAGAEEWSGLGVHLTLGLDGSYRLGPDAQWSESKKDLSPAPHKHAAFLRAARRLIGAIPSDALTYESCGLRPKVSGPGDAPKDFEIIESPAGAFHLLGIESPGLTASLALADELSRRIRRR